MSDKDQDAQKAKAASRDEIVQMLTAEPERRRWQGLANSLVGAALRGDIDSVKAHLAKNERVDDEVEEVTALEAAAWRGDTVMVKLLLEAKADPSREGHYQSPLFCTPLLAAVGYGHWTDIVNHIGAPLPNLPAPDHAGVIKVLLAAGAKANYGDTRFDNFFSNCSAAIKLFNVEAVKALLENGAQIAKDADELNHTGDLSLAKSLDVSDKDAEMQKTKTEQKEAIINLLNAEITRRAMGAKQQAWDAHLKTIVGAAFRGDRDAVKVFLAQHADVNQRVEGTTALAAAAWHGDIAMVNLLIDAGADVHSHGEKNPVIDAALGWGDWADWEKYGGKPSLGVSMSDREAILKMFKEGYRVFGLTPLFRKRIISWMSMR